MYDTEKEEFKQNPANVVDATPDGDTVKEGFNDRLTPALTEVYQDMNLLKAAGMIGVGVPATNTARGIGRSATAAEVSSGKTGANGPAWVTPEALKGNPVARYDLCEFYHFRHPTLKPGFQPAHGGVIANAAVLYPKAWAYLQTVEGQKLCKTEAEWQAMVNAVWHTNADGSRVGWNGIGGAPFYVLNTGNGTLRMPDLRGMYMEAAGFDAIGVGGVHGDGARRVQGNIYAAGAESTGYGEGALYPYPFGRQTIGNGAGGSIYGKIGLDTARVVPPAAKNQPRAWGSLACVCLDPAAS